MKITITKIPHNGALLLSVLTETQYIKKVYYGYTRKEALYEFKSYLKSEGV